MNCSVFLYSQIIFLFFFFIFSFFSFLFLFSFSLFVLTSFGISLSLLLSSYSSPCSSFYYWVSLLQWSHLAASSSILLGSLQNQSYFCFISFPADFSVYNCNKPERAALNIESYSSEG